MGRRFFDDQAFADDGEYVLGADASHHIARVLRMRDGDALTVFNGEGGEWPAAITGTRKQGVTVRTGAHVPDDRTPALHVTIALPAIKGERMDIALQKATELGARRFQLIDTEHADVRLPAERLAKKMGHWQRVVISACEQCGMNRIPDIAAPVSLGQALQASGDLVLFGQPGARPLLQADLSGVEKATLITGPEGGFSETELSLLSNSAARGIALGERILRAETAPLALLAGLWALTGQ